MRMFECRRGRCTPNIAHDWEWHEGSRVFSDDEMEEVEERALLNEGEGVIAESGSRVGGLWTGAALRKNA